MTLEKIAHCIKMLKANRATLTPEERSEVMRGKAAWHHGPNGEATPAVWKAMVKNKPVYVTNTHRAYATADTIKGAVKKYHNSIKATS